MSDRSAAATRLRAVTLSLVTRHGEWPARRAALRTGLRQLAPDVQLLQEAVGGGVMSSDHYGVLADLEVGEPDRTGRPAG